ncbi:MAG: hypothetical protein ACI4NG_04295, partial [Candidatus Gallimonas sp.]
MIIRLNDRRHRDKVRNPVGDIEKNALNLKRLFSDKEKEIKGFTASEKAYNEKANAIVKAAERIAAQVAKENDPAKVEKLQLESVKKMNELKALQKAECDRLKEAFKDGKITSYYLKNRTDKIGSLEHNKSTAMFEADAFPSKDDYIKSTGLEELTSDEKKGLYESAKLRAQDEKQKFLGRRILEEQGTDPDRPEQKPFLPKEEISADGVAKAMNFNLVDTQEMEMPKPVEANPSAVVADREPIDVPEANDAQAEIEEQAKEPDAPVIDKLP